MTKKQPCEMCGEPTTGDVTFDEGPIGTEKCMTLCAVCQARIHIYIGKITRKTISGR